MFWAFVYLIILVASGLGIVWDDPRVVRISGFAQWVLFAIIFYHLFYPLLSGGKG